MKSFWLSNKISETLTEFNVFLLHEINYKIDFQEEEEEELIRLGAINVEKIRSFRQKLEDALYKDFKDLHNIKSFISSVKSDKNYILNRP